VGQTAKTATEHWLAGTPSGAKPAESTVKAGRVKYPKHLSPAARTEMKRAALLIEARGHLTPADAGVLAVYGTIYSRWAACTTTLEAEGLMLTVTVTDSQGSQFEKQIKHPLLDVAVSCERQLLALQKTLGLTPGDRDKVKKAAPGGDVITFRPGSVGAMLQAEGKIYGKDF
jgi:P27 family predicted phage terminase small subunit